MRLPGHRASLAEPASGVGKYTRELYVRNGRSTESISASIRDLGCPVAGRRRSIFSLVRQSSSCQPELLRSRQLPSAARVRPQFTACSRFWTCRLARPSWYREAGQSVWRQLSMRTKFCSGLHKLRCCRRQPASRMAFASRPSAITASSLRRANPLRWICTGRCNIQWRMTSLCLSTFWMATASQLRE